MLATYRRGRCEAVQVMVKKLLISLVLISRRLKNQNELFQVIFVSSLCYFYQLF